MFNIGGGEVLVILLLALVVLGPDRLPGAARTFGKHLGDFRRISGGFRDEIANAMNLESSAPTSVSEPAPAAASAPIPTSEPARPAGPPVATRPAPTAPAAPEQPAAVRSEGPVDSFA